jgi:isoquinoline 1-oxidoreductase alpha subunit
MSELTVTLSINDRPQRFVGDGAMPLLWLLRDRLRLTGTKFGCGVGQCGACTVHLNGRAARACQLPMAGLDGARIVTIEGLARGDTLHPVQQAWLEADVAQCGYCQAGQIMAAVDLLQRWPQPTEADIDGITNLCRCGTHVRIRQAIQLAAERLGAGR